MEKDKINSFIKGLNKDSYELNHDVSSYSFALNGINESDKGDFSALSVEIGNVECLNLPVGCFPIGNILLNNNETILFIKNKENTINQIVLANLNQCSTKTIVNSTCLDFQNQVQGVFRVLNGCDRII